MSKTNNLEQRSLVTATEPWTENYFLFYFEVVVRTSCLWLSTLMTFTCLLTSLLFFTVFTLISSQLSTFVGVWTWVFGLPEKTLFIYLVFFFFFSRSCLDLFSS